MSGKEENRIFVGGLGDVTERQLEHAFDRCGKILECQITTERDTGRALGFITFSDRRGMEDAIKEMDGREIGDRIISVTKAQQGDRGGSSGGRGRDRVGQDDCRKCGRPGHWARDCPLAVGGERERYIDDRYDGGRYGDRDRLDNRDYKYSGRGDRYASDRYTTSGDRSASDRYGSGSDYPQNGYGKERGYDRNGGARGGADRYGSGMPARDEGRSYRGRPGPHDRLLTPK